MLQQSVDMDTFISLLRTLVDSVVVKRDEKAAVYETAEMRSKADKYIMMKNGANEWEAFARFDYDVLYKAGLTTTEISAVLAGNKEAVPYELRELVCQYQAEAIIAEYVEENTYYRMLNGEPPLDVQRADYVYLPENDVGLPRNLPIHMFTDEQIEVYNASGLSEQVFRLYPHAPYVLFMGTNAVSYYKARSASNYEIIRINKGSNANIARDFLANYAASRRYVITALYSKSDQKIYSYYDSFMGLVIMSMAIQRTFTSIFKQGITREFYDDNLIRDLFTGYNIPYIESISVQYQRNIAKKLNLLLQKKSSNVVLFDIADIFNYSNINIYQYYLMKDYYKNEDGTPIIHYKTVYDENGIAHEIIDAEKTYDIYFQKVNIRAKDKTAELHNNANRVEYRSVTGGDPYWIEDVDLIDKVYNSKYNSTLTKYMSIDISYEMSKLMYELCYSVRMIIDDQVEYKLINIDLPYTADPVSLFDAVCFMCALVAKKYHLEGNVPLQPYQIAQVYGFNFKEDIPALKEQIMRDIDSGEGIYKAVNEEVLQYLNELHADTLNGAKLMFENINNLRKYLDNAMRYTTDLDVYQGYWKLYQTCLVTRDVQELYTKTDGTYASTFVELLQNRRPDLYDTYEESGNPFDPILSDEQKDIAMTSINNCINVVLDRLAEISDELANLSFVNDKEAIVNNIEKIINQFKSYTVDQLTSEVLYMIDDPHMCMLKILDKLMGYTISGGLNDELKFLAYDVIDGIHYRRLWNDELNIGGMDMGDSLHGGADTWIDEFIHFHHKLLDLGKKGTLNDRTILFDALHEMVIERKVPSDTMGMEENVEIHGIFNENHRLHFGQESFRKYMNDPTKIDRTLMIDTLSDEPTRTVNDGPSFREQLHKTYID